MASGPSVVVRCGEQSVHVEPGGRCVIGRSTRADLRIVDRTVSRAHADVSVSDGRVWITDLGSKRGTFVNGVQIQEMTQLAGPSTINLSGAQGVAIVVEAGGHAAARSYPGEGSAVGRLVAAVRRKPAVAAVIIGIGLVGILGFRVLWPGGGALAEDQLVVVTVQPTAAAPQTGTAVVVDGDRQLIAVPSGEQSSEVTAYLVQLPLEDGRVFDVAAIRVAEADGVDVLRLIGASAVPEVESQLSDFGTISLGELGSADDFWTYGLGEDGLPGATEESLTSSETGKATAQPDHPWAFGPIIEGNRVVGFTSSGCAKDDGGVNYDLVDAEGAQDAVEEAEERANSVGPAPVLSSLTFDYAPRPCE